MSVVPPLLWPYLRNSLANTPTLVTSTISSTSSWLVFRYIHVALREHRLTPSSNEADVDRHEGKVSVVLVSWLRDHAWWKDRGSKLSIDMQKVFFVDGVDSGVDLGRGIPLAEQKVQEALAKAREVTEAEGRILLILDGLDFLGAATGCEVIELLHMLGELQSGADSTILTAAADAALIQSPTTHLESSQAAFVCSLAHQAKTVISLRPLDTGASKDVSGVLRITRGSTGSCKDSQTEEVECLFFVGLDGGLQVFERGSLRVI